MAATYIHHFLKTYSALLQGIVLPTKYELLNVIQMIMEELLLENLTQQAFLEASKPGNKKSYQIQFVIIFC